VTLPKKHAAFVQKPVRPAAKNVQNTRTNTARNAPKLAVYVPKNAEKWQRRTELFHKQSPAFSPGS